MTDTTDFTVEHYAELLELAKAQYKFIPYTAITLDQRFILWRHDCDFSLNRARRLARIEQAHDVRSTYFLNPHCEFYNLLEREQAAIIEVILACGHDIALHFDAAFYQIASEDELDELVAKESGWLKDWFGVEPTAFSFHNPDAFLLTCERDSYGGLINCYSRKFKDSIPYCSDSNGYWRYRRLQEVLERAEEPCLQVLTHPGWWQEEPLYPRQRIFRSVYGRADAAMKLYDNTLRAHGRENLGGPACSLAFLRVLDPKQFNVLDYLWHKQAFQTLFLELSRMHGEQLLRLCKIFFGRHWGVPAAEVDQFLVQSASVDDVHLLFFRTFGTSWMDAIAGSEDLVQNWEKMQSLISRRISGLDDAELQNVCAYLCDIINAMAHWGTTHPKIHHDGIADATDRLSEPVTGLITGVVLSSDWAVFKSSFQSG
ncbi:MAG: hypothetical protein V4451_00875 [Pseudomonadota bacterium]